MKDPEGIKNLLTAIDGIIFDLGGVVVNIDYMKTQKAFEDLGLGCFGKVYSQAVQTGVFDQYEKGTVDTHTFRDKLRQLAPNLTLSDSDIDNAWNAMLLDTPADRLAALSRLKSSFRTFLLSNTNELHIGYYHKQLEAAHGKESLGSYFEKVYYSYQIHLRKPDVEIFEYVLRENKLNAQRTLFIDDTIRHIESAESIGIQTLHIDSSYTLDNLYVALSEY
jgi:putative hydrolase of the HAD superfamily